LIPEMRRGILKRAICDLMGKMQTNCIFSAPVLIPLHVQLCILSVFMCFYHNLVLVTEYHVEC